MTQEMLLAGIAIEAAIIGYMLRHYFMRIERMILDFQERIVALERHTGIHERGD